MAYSTDFKQRELKYNILNIEWYITTAKNISRN